MAGVSSRQDKKVIQVSPCCLPPPPPFSIWQEQKSQDCSLCSWLKRVFTHTAVSAYLGVDCLGPKHGRDFCTWVSSFSGDVACMEACLASVFQISPPTKHSLTMWRGGQMSEEGYRFRTPFPTVPTLASWSRCLSQMLSSAVAPLPLHFAFLHAMVPLGFFIFVLISFFMKISAWYYRDTAGVAKKKRKQYAERTES